MSSNNRVESEDSAVEKCGKPREYDANFNGPIKNRSCTDIICCFLFLLFLVGYGVISAYGFLAGNPTLLIYPTDTQGNLCGYGDMKDKPYLFFFDITKCAQVLVSGFKCPTPQVCLKACPEYNWAWPESTLTNNRDRMICKYDVNATTDSRTVQDLVFSGDCAPYIVSESPVVSRCLPSIIGDSIDFLTSTQANNTESGFLIDSAAFQEGMKAMNSVIGFANAVFNDFLASWRLIVFCLTLAALFSLLWLILLRFLAGIVIWLLLLSFILVFGGSSGYSVYRYVDMEGSKNSGEFKLTTDLNFYLNQGWFWLTLAIITGIIFLIVLVIVVFLRGRIRVAVALIGQASRALAYMLEVLIFPLLPFVLHTALITYCVLLAAYLATVKSKAPNTSNSTQTESTNSSGSAVTDLWISICNSNKSATAASACEVIDSYGTIASQIFNVFMAFWLFFFITGFSQMTVAGSFASFYFARRKPQDVPCCSVFRSFGRVLSYHVGTVAFGSLLIALLKIIRALFEYVKRKTESENCCAKFLLKCASCCLWCLEKCLKFITKNAYIMTAIRGRNFCFSAKDAFFLIMRNCLRAFVIDNVTRFLLFIGELVVVGCAGFFSYLFFTNQIDYVSKFVPQLTYFYVPVIVVVIGTYIIAATFFSVYDMGVDTLFLCFLEDLEMNDGTPEKPYYMSKSLRKILGKKNRELSAATDSHKTTEL